MLMHEPGTRAGIDPEELHDMRVATRRMRVAAQVLGDHLDADMLRPHVRGMRRTGRGLGPVRDLDVFWESVETSQSALRDSHDLEPLRAAWGRAHARAREGMLAYLDGAQYRRFVERFGEQLHRPWLPAHPAISSKGEALVRRIRHVAPALVLDRLADVLAYEEWVLDPHREVPLRRYHRLRIAIKQLRYTLEYLRELLGNDVRPVIKTVKQVQSHLGDLQDAVVGCAFIRDFLMWGELDPDPVALPEPPVQPVVAPDVAELFVHWQRQIGNRVQTFPDVWRQRITPDLQLKIAHLATDMAARAP
jgi:CHAD domain-containing protein